MIGYLRFLGVANAAIWFGTAVFYCLCAAPALSSHQAQAILGGGNFPYFGGALNELLRTRYLLCHLLCAVIALVHLAAEWLYLGKTTKRFWVGLTVLLFWLSLIGAFWLGPKLQELHRGRYFTNASTAQRELANRSFRLWQGAFQLVNVILVAGVAGYFWRITHPPDELRFVGTPKFRG